MLSKKAREDYDGFVAKFKPKRTSDDCFTPPLVVEAVTAWVLQEYRIAPAARVLRPFWPGRDYTAEDYTGAIVIDNPPFSILGAIVRFYMANAIPFFLFAPALTSMHYLRHPGISLLVTSANVTYENGAEVRTAFLTNLEPETTARTVVELDRLIAKAMKATMIARGKVELPAYKYPPNVITYSSMASLALRGVDFRLTRANSVPISTLESQKAAKKSIFGSALLVSTAKAAEAASEARKAPLKACETPAVAWPLSPSEIATIQTLDNNAKE